jgi:hypothetical protein
MIDGAQAGTLLGELGEQLGLGALTFDEQHRCTVEVEGGAISIDLTFSPSVSAIDLMVDLGEVGLSPARLEALLAANFCGLGADGAAFALDPLSGALVLQRRFVEDELVPGGLRTAFEQLVHHARAWPERIAAIEESEARGRRVAGPEQGGLRA